MAELTCEICYTLLYQPVTTPCQHTFCAKCLQRSLDHNNACPLCRQDLPPFHYFQDHPYNQVLLAIILKTFPETYAERGRTIEEEEKAARLDTPLFVCQLSFPGMPTLLHIFEPRYRLMLRRCLSSATPLFGMIMPPRSSSANGGQTEYGTMLEVRSVQMLPDGRSMVETWGVWRFRILERAIVDGYLVGRIERIDDFEEELEGVDGVDLESYGGAASTSRVAAPRADLGSSPTNEELMAVCHGFLDQLRHGTAPWVVQRLNNTYGPMPTTASEFSFWMALVLPIDEHEKAKLLPIRSPRLRLRLVVHWIEQLNSNWWFSSGCVIL
ncbi:LON-domain-containing protein [Heliocybe sulcata]|uniref:LON-domain-containing protein n=1 Tax=Heliocybe sulcata TaxID=5364 RepID=A0A5C3NHZ9_9AGAM|nr:LON-domain-containing protein [Heliocybe sulcata]